MSLLDEMKLNLRVTGDWADDEITMLIEGAKADMVRVGVERPLVEEGDHPLVKNAIACYCKSRFGFDNPDARRFEGLYRQCVCDLLNSSANIAAQDGSYD